MISPSSLSAFSPVPSAGGATRIAAPPPQDAPGRQKTLQALPATPPTRPAPRGSLLDLSV